MMIALSIAIGLLVVSTGLNIILYTGFIAAMKRIKAYEDTHGVKI